MKLTVINPPTDFWDSVSDTAYPALLKYGYTLFVKDGEPTEFLRVIYSNGEPQSNSEVGYTFVQEVPPNAGFSNTGNTFDWIRGDVGLQAVADAYGVDNPMTYEGLGGLFAGTNLKKEYTGVYDRNVAIALQADDKLLDVVMIGDSNQLLGGNGWDLSIDKVLSDKYGMYGTALISANENNGNGANQGYEYSRLNGGLIGVTTGQPEPFASMWKGISYNLPSYLALGESVPPVKNNALIIRRDCPIGVNNELTFRVNYANFSSDGGVLYPRVRLEESPYSNQTPIETVNCSGTDEMTCYDLVMPAAVRDKHISYKFAYAETLNGKLFIPFTHAFKTGASSGIAAHSLIAQGGASLEQMLDLLLDSTLEQTSYYFSVIRDRQIDLGQSIPNIVVRINSGLNDRNQVDSTAATYKIRLQAIIDRIKDVWAHKGWSANELSFIITPSHRISDPDDSLLVEYRNAAREIALSEDRCSMADFNDLMTYQEAIDNAWYLNGNDTSHLDVVGSEECATRELDLLTKEWIPESDFRVTEKDGVFTDWAVQPYEQKFYSDGAAAYTSDGKEEWVIKTFE